MIEAYPALVVLDRASYKDHDRKKQTQDHRVARNQVVSWLRSQTLKGTYGFVFEMDRSREREPVRDPAADALDSLLCAVQAAWAYTKSDENYGVPPERNPDEGWILDPELLVNGRT